MTNTLTYKGYVATLEIDFDKGVIHGEVINTRDVLTFSVTTVAEAKAELAATIDDYLAWCQSEGEVAEKPYSGTISLRLTPEVHRLAAVRAATEGSSLNAWIARVLDCELGRRPASISAVDLEKRFTGVREEVARLRSEVVFTVGQPLEPGDEWLAPPKAERLSGKTVQ